MSFKRFNYTIGNDTSADSSILESGTLVVNSSGQLKLHDGATAGGNSIGGTYSNSNVAAFLGAFGGNSITWQGGSTIFEDTVLVLQGAVGVAIGTPGTTQITSGTAQWTFGTDHTLVGNSSDANVYIETVIGSTTNTWKFDQFGSLTLPGGIINSPGNNVGMTAVDTSINLASWNSAQSSPNSLVNLNPTNVVIAANVYAAEKQWTFDQSGTLTAPGDAIFAGNVIAGNLHVLGNTLITSSTELTIANNLLNLHTQANLAPWTYNDGTDIGIKFHYYNTQDSTAFLGLANDTGYLEWYNQGTDNGNVFSGTSYGTIKTGNVVLANALIFSDSTTQTTAYTGPASTLVNGSYTVSLAADGSLRLPTSQYGTAQLYGPSGEALFVGTLDSGNYWQFKPGGALQFPDSTIQTTAYTGPTYGNTQVAAYLVQNPQSGTYSNANVASYLPTSSVITSINANVSAANAAIVTANTAMKSYVDSKSSTYTNANVASYLPTYGGNINVGNITMASNASTISFPGVGASIYTDSVNRIGSIVLQPAATGTFPGVLIGGSGRILSPSGSVHLILNPTDFTVQVAQKINVGTASTSTTTGALQVSGGIGVTGNAYIGGNSVITGNVIINGNAAISMPNLPAFRVYGSGNTTNLSTTVNGTGILNSNNWAIDYTQGNALNSTTGVFTAPVAGLYQVNLVARVVNNTSPSAQVIVYKNWGSGNVAQAMWETGANSTVNHFGVGTISKLAVGDTLTLKVTVGSINFDGNDNWSVAFLG